MRLQSLLVEIMNGDDPWSVLGLTDKEEDDETIRAAYERLQAAASGDDLKRRRLREAWERIGTRRSRIRCRLLSPRSLESPEELIGLVKSRPRYTGPGTWLKSIRDLSARGVEQQERTR